MKIIQMIIALQVLFITTLALGQSGTQIIRGTVFDKVSESPIPGAKVVILNTDPPLRVLTDFDGKFKIPNVPVGRQDLIVSYAGYHDLALRGLIVDAGKETVLNIKLEEKIVEKNMVTVKGRKQGPQNEMSLVSIRTFSVEETQKYAAALNDPARMATSFAGVVALDGINNDISIRGNSPRGLIWRMEGVEIPNPNHFSGVGTSGGGISLISAQLMGNSDFSTGAFAAEYGNALSGVFDLSLRKGNNEKREYTIQAGVLGLDVAMEGPFKKGYDGSYLVNYRYSTLGLLSQIVPIGDNLTTFQDLSLNIYLPTKNFGNFGLFGIGGISSDQWRSDRDTAQWRLEPWTQFEGSFRANTGILGAWHKVRTSKNSYLKTNFAFSTTLNGDYNDSLDYTFLKHRQYEEEFIQKKLTLQSVYTHKLSAKTNLRSGIIFNHVAFSLIDRYRYQNVMKENLNESGQTNTLQGFLQFSHKLGNKLTLNTGVHYLHLFLNNTYSLEPRLSMGYKLSTNQAINLGYGHHSQIQPLGSYFGKVTDDFGGVTRPNMDLELNKAHHLVLSYNIALGKVHKLKAEVYFQQLYQVPLGVAQDSTFSLLNSDYGYVTSELQSTGNGQNYGLEITFDRSLHRGLYYLISASVFESKFKAMNGNWYDTKFNTNFVVAVTGGKEWTMKNKEKPRTLGINIKSVATGGLRYTPYDLTTYVNGNYPDRDYSKAYDESVPIYFRIDTRLSLKRNYKKVTSTISLDLQNTLNRKIVGGQYFDVNVGKVVFWHMPGILPILSYRLTF